MNDENKKKWFGIVLSIVKYAAAAVFGGLGFGAISGCNSIPVFFF